MKDKFIKNIIFDLGGVILNIDPALTINAFKKLGLENFETLYSQAQEKQLFDDFETGKFAAEEFRSELKKYIPKAIGNQEIDLAWNAMLLDLPEERLTLLSSIKDKYRIFLLSNTNEIHIDTFSSYLGQLYRFPDLSHIFEKEYYSYKIGMRKPNAEIFEFVLKENGLQAGETLFIDDSFQHIETAERLGIQTHHLLKPQTILDLKF